ncbi:MAG: hypothetical protein EOO45_07735 [Flavobacterium sp.]|nr:MAG: hypothetical protein EOO45_07735 [Flavobacterium sp.]
MACIEILPCLRYKACENDILHHFSAYYFIIAVFQRYPVRIGQGFIFSLNLLIFKMKLETILLFLSLIFISTLCYSQGCVINNYNGFNRVFITPTAADPKKFQPGNGNNFVRWEGTCGPHTYVQTTSVANGSCTVTESGNTRTGDYYPTVSGTFTRTCNVPLDDHIWWIMLLLIPLTFLYFRKLPIKKTKSI